MTESLMESCAGVQGVTAYKDRIATVDDPLVQRLEEQGAVIVGEVHVHRVLYTCLENVAPTSCLAADILGKLWVTVSALMLDSCWPQARPTRLSLVLAPRHSTSCLVPQSIHGTPVRPPGARLVAQQLHWLLAR